MADIPFDTAHFFGLVLSTWLYVIFLRMFLSSIWPLGDRRHQPGGKFVVATTSCLFVTATSHIVIGVAKGYDLFITYRDLPGLMRYTEERFLLKATLSSWFFMLAIWNAEVILIWRLWIIWSRDWRVVIPPAVFFVIEFAAGIFLCVKIGPRDAFDNPRCERYDEEQMMLGISLLLVNLICTPLVVVRLWWVGRYVQIRQTQRLYQTIAIRLIESGGLYTAVSIVWVISDLWSGTSFPGIAILINYVFQITIAIAPMMIFSLLSRKAASEMVDVNVSNLEPPREDRNPPRQSFDNAAIASWNPRPPSVASEAIANDPVQEFVVMPVYLPHSFRNPLLLVSNRTSRHNGISSVSTGMGLT
ncbi:hypothetical protein FRB93_002583 [Tulasnella sp. JGI-2019a]|nr:hypothetical protein FRB93_002583 [Tulasnella sp. JGI-2019a]